MLTGGDGSERLLIGASFAFTLGISIGCGIVIGIENPSHSLTVVVPLQRLDSAEPRVSKRHRNIVRTSETPHQEASTALTTGSALQNASSGLRVQ